MCGDDPRRFVRQFEYKRKAVALVASTVGAAAGLLRMPEHFIKIERRRLLARRELHEVLDLSSDDCLHLADQRDVIEHPVPVICYR